MYRAISISWRYIYRTFTNIVVREFLWRRVPLFKQHTLRKLLQYQWIWTLICDVEVCIEGTYISPEFLSKSLLLATHKSAIIQASSFLALGTRWAVFGNAQRHSDPTIINQKSKSLFEETYNYNEHTKIRSCSYIHVIKKRSIDLQLWVMVSGCCIMGIKPLS